MLSRVAWCWSVRLSKRFALNVVRPVRSCVVLSGGVRLQNVCKARLDATSWVPTLLVLRGRWAGLEWGESPTAVLGQVGGAVVGVDGTAEV